MGRLLWFTALIHTWPTFALNACTVNCKTRIGRMKYSSDFHSVLLCSQSNYCFHTLVSKRGIIVRVRGPGFVFGREREVLKSFCVGRPHAQEKAESFLFFCFCSPVIYPLSQTRPLRRIQLSLAYFPSVIRDSWMDETLCQRWNEDLVVKCCNLPWLHLLLNGESNWK